MGEGRPGRRWTTETTTCSKDEWKRDVMPEIMDGKNIADFVDPAIEKRLEELEEEEAREADEAAAESDGESDLDEEEKSTLKRIKDKKAMVVAKHRGKSLTPKFLASLLLRRARASNSSKASRPQDTALTPFNPKSRAAASAIARDLLRPAARTATVNDPLAVSGQIQVGGCALCERQTRRGLSQRQAKARREATHEKEPEENAADGTRGRSDRYIGTKMPKYLFSGKRGNGTAHHR